MITNQQACWSNKGSSGYILKLSVIYSFKGATSYIATEHARLEILSWFIPGKVNSVYSWYLNGLCPSLQMLTCCSIKNYKLLITVFTTVFLFFKSIGHLSSIWVSQLECFLGDLVSVSSNTYTIIYPTPFLDLIHLLASYLCLGHPVAYGINLFYKASSFIISNVSAGLVNIDSKI